MARLIEIIAALVFLPIAGGFVLGVANAVWLVATAQSTPKWQQYLWFLAVGWGLFHLRELGWAFVGHADY